MVTDYTYYNDDEAFLGTKAALSAYLDDNVCLRWTFGLGFPKRSGSVRLHTPTSTLTGGIVTFIGAAMLAGSDSTETLKKGLGGLLTLGGIALIILPEAVGVDFPLSDELTLTTYLSPLGADYYKLPGDVWRAHFSSGAQIGLITKPLDMIRIGGFAGFNYIYVTKSFGPQAGVQASFIF